MEIICLTVGDLATNCYLVTDEETRHTLIIDPGNEADFISTTILEKKITPQAIVLTHGHYDHCLAALELKLNFNIPIYLHRQDLFLYEKAHLSASFWSNKSSLRVSYSNRGNLTPPPLPPIDKFISDGEVIPFGHSSLQVLHTPGHTPGSVCLFSVCHSGLDPESSPLFLFTGDTLFAEGIGRTDLSYSSPANLQKSLSLLKKLPSNTLIYPGHEDFGLPLVATTPRLFS